MKANPSASVAPETDTPKSPPEMAVVVISVGAPPELEAAVASILRQDVAVELVLVNSGGGDVRKWLSDGGKGVRIVESEKLWTHGTARNMGIQASHAPYVAFLAADCEALEGWARHRLQHHRGGATAVASAVVNSHPLSLVAWASHLALFPNHFPGTSADRVAHFGASYDRQLFVRHGLFEEIRIGEESEFHKRIGNQNAPKWVPEVRTTHRNETSLIQAWKDQHRRGLRSGKHWPQIHKGPLFARIQKKLARFFKISQPSLFGRDKMMATASLPLLALNFLIFERAANRGKTNPDPVSPRDGKARAATAAKKWKTALKLWRKSNALEPSRFTPMLGIATCQMGMEHYEEAENAYMELRDAWPQIETGYIGIAAAATQVAAWDRVLVAQQAVVRISPGQPLSHHRVGNTLLMLGRKVEADETARHLREDFPSIRAGFSLGAEIALQGGEWEQAIAYFEHLVFAMNDWKTVPKWTELLLCLDRLESAACLAERLMAAGAPVKAILHASGPWLTASHRWEDLFELFGKHGRAVRTDARLLQAHIPVLARHGKLRRALALIRTSTLLTPEWRSYLEIMALLHGYANDRALSRFRKIWKRRKIIGFPIPLQAPILEAAVREEGPAFAADLLDRLEKGSRGTAQELPWKLTAVFRRERLRWLEGLSQSSWAGLPEVPLETQVAEILASWPGARRFTLLSEVCCRMQESRQRHPAFFPDPYFVLSDALEVADLIATSIDFGRPLSLVRLGDGEGNLLPYREEFEPLQPFDRLAKQRSWWGDHIPADAIVDDFKESLAEALTTADILGIPDLQRACRAIQMNWASELTPRGKNARGLLASLDFAAGLDVDRLITSCHIHEALAYWGLWDLLLPRAKRISLITCHAQLAGKLTELHAVTIGEVHLIPPQKKFSASFGNNQEARHFPDTYLELQEKLTSVPPGEVFLVAAGVLGKIYCHWIKQAGGIALDIGSAADFWCGFGTRGLDGQAAYRRPDAMMEQYRSLAGSDPRIAKLIAGL